MRDPREMTPSERFTEIAELLARGLLRSLARKPPSDSGVEPPTPSGVLAGVPGVETRLVKREPT